MPLLRRITNLINDNPNAAVLVMDLHSYRALKLECIGMLHYDASLAGTEATVWGLPIIVGPHSPCCRNCGAPFETDAACTYCKSPKYFVEVR
jgi:hypothetical protein